MLAVERDRSADTGSAAWVWSDGRRNRSTATYLGARQPKHDHLHHKTASPVTLSACRFLVPVNGRCNHATAPSALQMLSAPVEARQAPVAPCVGLAGPRTTRPPLSMSAPGGEASHVGCTIRFANRRGIAIDRRGGPGCVPTVSPCGLPARRGMSRSRVSRRCTCSGPVASRGRSASSSGWVRFGSGSVTATSCTAARLAGADAVTDGNRPARYGTAAGAGRALATDVSSGAARGQTALRVTGYGCALSGLHGDRWCFVLRGAEGSDRYAASNALSRSSGPLRHRSGGTDKETWKSAHGGRGSAA